MSPVHLRNLGIPRNNQEYREEVFPEPEDLEEETLDTVVDGKTLREIIPTLPLTFQFKKASNQRTGNIWIKFFSSTNSSNIYFNGAWKTRGSTWHPTGQNWSKIPEDLSQRPYGNNQRLESHQAVQTPGGDRKQDKGESSHYPSYGRTADPDRA
ncbi:hypothetical protein O181_036771 [Austropuccinia psidii MF-1]|uniref:Uncharacterized protein n=1 Tax=Austropuccinia psidii MF-1 TaxID=1389203 RepID=A0A9Q3D512_9BASI|nr:hypothetical protein [Austropuccinia psidii MF-1]